MKGPLSSSAPNHFTPVERTSFESCQGQAINQELTPFGKDDDDEELPENQPEADDTQQTGIGDVTQPERDDEETPSADPDIADDPDETREGGVGGVGGGGVIDVPVESEPDDEPQEDDESDEEDREEEHPGAEDDSESDSEERDDTEDDELEECRIYLRRHRP